MKVFCDLHHFDLFYSFQIIFGHLGWELYRPIGEDWYHSGFWDLSSGLPVIEAYLSTEDGRAAEIMKGHPVLQNPEWARYGIEMLRIGEIEDLGSGFYQVLDLSKNKTQKACTLEAFCDTNFDIVISSVPQHFNIYQDLIAQYKTDAKHIFHMGPGNTNWTVPPGAKNLMLHTPPLGEYLHTNHVFYCQPFDLDVFRYKPPSVTNVVNSYTHFPESQALMDQASELCSDVEFKVIGKPLGPTADIIVKTSDIAQSIINSAFTWHVKPGGESYGHVIHNTFACGRPPIVNVKDFQDKRAGKLMEDMVTCISSDRDAFSLSGCIEEVIKKDRLEKMCKAAYERFQNEVDFDKEFLDIERFLGQLK